MMRAIIILTLLGIQCVVNAQTDTSKVYDYQGTPVKYITIEKGKTLYSLARETKVSQDTLLMFNPELSQGLKAGMKVRIPLKAEINNKSKEPGNASGNKSAIRHEVQKGETIFSISKKYGLSSEELLLQNPEASGGLKTGSILNIYPKPPEKPQKPNATERPEQVTKASPVDPNDSRPEPKNENKTSPCRLNEEAPGKRTVKVSMLLPLFSNSGEEMPSKAKIGLEFFSGARLAMDSLKKAGYRMEVNLYDTQADSLEIQRILKKKELLESDVIIGPLYASDFKQVSVLAKEKGIWAVSPFSQSDAIITSNPSAFKITPDQETQLKVLSRFLLKEKKNARFFLIRNSNVKDAEYCDWVAEVFKSEGDTSNGRFREINYSGVSELLEGLSEAHENVLIFPTTVQVQVIDAASRLNSARLGKRITLVGLNEWNQFENIEYDYLNNLNFTYASPVLTDFQSGASKRFQQAYREEFKGEPGIYAYHGYDATQFFIRTISKYGKPEPECISGISTMCGFNSCYQFIPISKGSGLENHFVNIIRLDDFEHHRLNTP